MGQFFALVVNPRDGELIQAIQSSKDSDVIFTADMAGKNAGKGYFGARMHRAYNTCEEFTGFPRAHTEGGVPRKGKGLGTALYTSLVVAAAHNQNPSGEWLNIEVNVLGLGICSNSQRSRSASAWWDRAVYQFGLARRATLSPCEEDCETCDSYSFASALANHLIVAIENDPSSTYESAMHAESLVLVDPYALLGVNFGLLRSSLEEREQYREFSQSFVWRLWSLGMRAGIPQAMIERMMRQYSDGYDEELESPYGYVRENPSAGTMLRSRPKVYGRRGPRQNPTVSPEQMASDVQALRAIREANGWNKFLIED
jgi:hypothetical protein